MNIIWKTTPSGYPIAVDQRTERVIGSITHTHLGYEWTPLPVLEKVARTGIFLSQQAAQRYVERNAALVMLN